MSVNFNVCPIAIEIDWYNEKRPVKLRARVFASYIYLLTTTHNFNMLITK